MGLPANVASADWQTWLIDFPDQPESGLGAAMRYRRSVENHLSAIPSITQLDQSERRAVGDDLAHYCRILQGVQRTSLREAFISGFGAGGSLLAKTYVPTAEVILLGVAAGLVCLGGAKVYNIKRRERIIAKMVATIDLLSWRLKT